LTEVTVGLLIWIGVVITALAFDEDLHSRKAHGLAVAVGLVPCLAGWAFNLITDAIQAVDGLHGGSLPQPQCHSMAQLARQFGSSLYFKGVIALSQGFLFTSIIWSACMVFIIDREFERAAAWMLFASVLSMLGLIHGYDLDEFNNGCYQKGVVNKFGFHVAPDFGFAYCFASLLLLFLQWYDHGSLHLWSMLRSACRAGGKLRNSFTTAQPPAVSQAPAFGYHTLLL
jgi:AGZA family xanthine/uracil permease-like MFS transporter